MSINSSILSVAQEYAPCYTWDAYEGSLDERLSRYFVFNYETLPCSFGDDDAPYERYLIQLHYFCPRGENTVKLRKKIKRSLVEAGFTFPSETNVSDSDGQHYVFEFETFDSTVEEDVDGEA